MRISGSQRNYRVKLGRRRGSWNFDVSARWSGDPAPAGVEDHAGDNYPSPENGGPKADPLANEPCQDNHQQEGRIGPKYEDGSTAEAAHAGELGQTNQA